MKFIMNPNGNEELNLFQMGKSQKPELCHMHNCFQPFALNSQQHRLFVSCNGSTHEFRFYSFEQHALQYTSPVGASW